MNKENTKIEINRDTGQPEGVSSGKMLAIINGVAAYGHEIPEGQKAPGLSPASTIAGIEALALGYKGMRELYDVSPPDAYAEYYKDSWDTIEAALASKDPEQIAEAFNKLEHDLQLR